LNNKTNSNIKLSSIHGASLLRKQINKGIISLSVDNIKQIYNEIELARQKNVRSNKTKNKLQTIIELSDTIIKSNKSQLKLNLLNKNQFNLNLSKSENLNNLNNKLTKPILNESNSILNESNSILMNQRQYIRLLSPFNSKLASYTNHIYTFTNRPYKQINKNLNNIYTICKSAFLNLSSIISKPIVLINPNLIKITLFYYWKPLRNKYYNSNLHSNFVILYYNKLENLINLLSQLFGKSVELELIRIYSPKNESNILANLIGILSNFIKFRYIHKKLFKVRQNKKVNTGFSNRYNKPSILSGIYLKLAGRVLTQRLQRRVKSKIVQKGSLARTNTSLININRFVNKNKRGTFSITIKTGQTIKD